MKLTLGRTSLLALALMVAGASAVACAEAESALESPIDPPDAALPEASTEAGAADAQTDAAIDEDAAPRVCSDHGFCHTALPPDQTLEGVWGDGAGTVWAVTGEGNVLRWDGSAWNLHASDLGPLRAIWGSSATELWVGGDEGLYHGTGPSAGALTFASSALEGGARVRVRSIWGASASDVWAVGEKEADDDEVSGAVLHLDGGGTWALDPASANGVAYSHVWGSPGMGVWIAGQRPMPGERPPWWPPELEVAVLQRSPGASAFAEATVPGRPDPGHDPVEGRMETIYAATATSDTTMLVLGRIAAGLPAIWRAATADGGKTFTWTYASDGGYGEPVYRAVSGGAANDVWAVGDYGRVRHWDGTEWSPAAITITKLPVVDPFHAVWTGGASEVWFVGKDIALRYDPATKKDGGVK